MLITPSIQRYRLIKTAPGFYPEFANILQLQSKTLVGLGNTDFADVLSYLWGILDEG